MPTLDGPLRILAATPSGEMVGMAPSQAVALTFTGEGATVVVGLALTDPARGVAVRTRSFDVFHKSVEPALTARATALVRAVASAVAPRDPGGLALP